MEAIDKVRDGSIPATKIRNFCMLAHVDHGKTTLSDFLLSNNGVLSEALAGQVRYLDSRPDEQERLITMKASSVALRHDYKQPDNPATQISKGEYLCNLLDSPGHIDFSCEVSTAMRVCDGGVIIVDIIDGATMQTHLMLRQALLEGLSMVLVINKIDLAIVTQGLSAEEIFTKVSEIVTSCNVALAALISSLQIHSGGAAFESRKSVLHGAIPDDEVWFSPAKGNVLFCSCLDGWGFTLRDFARLYASKLPFTEDKLMEALWGEHFFVGKSIETKPKKEGQPPLFVTHVIQLLCKLYETTAEEPLNLESVDAMASKVGVQRSVWDQPAKRSGRQKLAAILSTWLPLASRLLDTICEKLDSPPVANKRRLSSLLPQMNHASKATRDALWKCDPDPAAPMVAFCAKLLDMGIMAGRSEFKEDEDLMDETMRKAHQEAEMEMENMFVSFGRIYSGRMKPGQVITLQSAGVKKEATLSKLYVLDGRGLVEVEDLPAGCLFCAAGVAESIVKCATFSTDPSLPPFRSLNLMSSSILKQTITPKNPRDLPRLLRGLRILNQTDTQLELSVLPTGDHVICCAGEVHSERCVVDLEERFARGLEFDLSPPIVTVRETIVAASLRPRSVTCKSINGHFSISMHALPLPDETVALMKSDEANNFTEEFQAQILDTFREVEHNRKKWADMLKNGVWAYGSRKFGFVGTLLLNGTPTITKPDSVENLDDLQEEWGKEDADLPSVRSDESGAAYSARLVKQFQDAILSGFEIGASAGPMAEEPIFGVAFVVDSIDFIREDATSKGMTLDGEFSSAGTLSGQVMATVAQACRKAMEEHGRRLVEPHYHCTVQSSGQTQGKIYAALRGRRAEIEDEVLHEGSDMFDILASLPAFESFGLLSEMRDVTHGAATATLRMSHWQVVEEDPYFKPTTKDEIEEMGSKKTDAKNTAEILLEKVRRRKGLHRESTVDAEKQKFSIRGA